MSPRELCLIMSGQGSSKLMLTRTKVGRVERGSSTVCLYLHMHLPLVSVVFFFLAPVLVGGHFQAWAYVLSQLFLLSSW